MAQYNIAIAGTGYVGMSLATLLAQNNRVIAVDIIPEKVDMINRRQTGVFGLPRRSGRPQGGSEGALASRREVGKICPAVRASGWTVGRRLPSREEIRSIP